MFKVFNSSVGVRPRHHFASSDGFYDAMEDAADLIQLGADLVEIICPNGDVVTVDARGGDPSPWEGA